MGTWESKRKLGLAKSGIGIWNGGLRRVLTGEGEDVAWHVGEEVRSKVQASMVGSAKGSVS